MATDTTNETHEQFFLASMAPEVRARLEKHGVNLASIQAELDAAHPQTAPPPVPDPNRPRNRQARRLHSAIATRNPAAAKPRTGHTAAKSAAGAAKQATRDRIYLQRLQKRLARLYNNDQPVPPVNVISRRQMTPTWHVRADRTGRAGRTYLDRHPHQIGAQLVRIAALGIDADGNARYDWTSTRAQGITAIGLLLLNTCRRTYRKGAWSMELPHGIPIGAFCAAVTDPYTRKRPSNSCMDGRHAGPDSRLEDGNVGWLTALRDVGLFHSFQIRADLADPCELIGNSGHPTARYWLINPDPLLRVTEDERRAALALLETELQTRRVNRRNPYTVYNSVPVEENDTGPPSTGPPEAPD